MKIKKIVEVYYNVSFKILDRCVFFSTEEEVKSLNDAIKIFNKRISCIDFDGGYVTLYKQAQELGYLDRVISLPMISENQVIIEDAMKDEGYMIEKRSVIKKVLKNYKKYIK